MGHPSARVVVITGASSGIGRAAARAFAREGACLVLASRDADALRAVEQACRSDGAQALVVPTDTGDAAQVDALAESAVAAFGRIDVWLNNAAVLALGRVEDIPLADHERLVRTNLLGYLHGTRVAVRRFRAQRHGVLINNASVLGAVSVPFASSYCASKWAIRGLSQSVRMELLDEPDVHVCCVLPAAVDTPIFRHAANYAGRAARAPEPVHSADRVAAALVGLARRPRREVMVGAAGRLAVLGHALWAGFTERTIAAFIERRQFEPRSVPSGSGNLFRSAGGSSGDEDGRPA